VDCNRRSARIKAIQRLNVESTYEWQPSKYSIVYSEHFRDDNV